MAAHAGLHVTLVNSLTLYQSDESAFARRHEIILSSRCANGDVNVYVMSKALMSRNGQWRRGRPREGGYYEKL